MLKKTLKVLEFDKILAMLKDLAVMQPTKDQIDNLEPSCDIDEVNKNLSETSEAESLILRKGNIPLSPVSDVDLFVSRAQIGASLHMREILMCAHCLRIARLVLSYFDFDSFSSDYPLLNEKVKRLEPLEKLEKRIFEVIVSEDEIADDASNELFSIRNRIRNLNNKIRDVLNSMIHSSKYSKYLQEPIITVRNDRFVIPVKSEYRQEVAGIIHDSSASGATLFVEPQAAVEINNELRGLFAKEKEEIERILRELTEEIAQNGDIILKNYKTLIDLDFVFAKGKLSLNYNGTRPGVNDCGIIDLKKARHPLIDKDKVVPTDIYLGRDFDTLVITGPNTGGKTVSLKTLGLFTLMAQAGLHIPASDGSEIAVFEEVFADIGDEQSIEQSLSTFSSHMVNIVKILSLANDKSLVLFDELGAGTDPVEGAALAVSILEAVKNKGAKCAATTHYSELKKYALSTERVKNAACEFDVVSLRPTYRLLIGVPGKSNAFAISKRLGLSDEIIERAKDLISTKDKSFEDVISSIERDRREFEQKLHEAKILKEQAEKELREANRQKKAIEERKTKILDEARREALTVLENAKKEADLKIKEIEKAAQDLKNEENFKNMQRARQALTESLSSLGSKIEGPFKKKENKNAPKSVRLGDRVEILSMEEEGTVLTLPDKDGNLKVQVGILTINTKLSDLRLINDDSTQKEIKRFTQTKVSGKSASIKPQIDVRGQTLDEAVANVEKYLDDVFLSSLEQITIVHGKGTGVLRKGIHDLLKNDKRVKEFRLGRFGEGEDGVTIVTLK